MKAEFRTMIDSLRERGIPCYFPRPDLLLVSLQEGPVWPDRGNSFQICHLAGAWHVLTWGPRYYRFTDNSRAMGFCESFVHCGDHARSAVPAELMDRFGLEEVDHDDFDKLFDAEMPAE